MAKNRTLIGIILIVIAIALCFGITPLFSVILEQKTTVIRLKEDIPQGAQVQPSMLEAVEVGTLNLPADMLTDPELIIGKYTVAAMITGDTFSPSKLSDTIDSSLTVICQDRTQALRLAQCENTTLHAVFVCRGDSEHKEEYLEAQRSVLGIEQIVNPDNAPNIPEEIPNEDTEIGTADTPELDLSAPVVEIPAPADNSTPMETADKPAIVISGGRG